MVKDLSQANGSFRTICKGFKFNYDVVEVVNDKVYILTDENAPNYKLVSLDLKLPGKAKLQTIIPERRDLLQAVRSCGGKFFAQYLVNVATQIEQYSLEGKLEKKIELPGIGTAGGFGGEPEDKISFYTYTSFNYPSTIFKFDLATGKSEVYRKPEIEFEPNNFEVKQEFIPSKDGTKVPVFIVHKKGLNLDGKNPTLLYGYGGFNISLTPAFNPNNLPFLENGGVYVLANLRGGGEFGEAWHKAGMLEKKQNVFDDFISTAEFMIAKGYTSKNHLAIEGGSNGGLLVGACLTQRPDLFKVAFPAVGVLDMLRFHKFTIGWGWVVEYGSSDTARHFPFLIKYSPLHNTKPGTNYPATLVTTADHDDRVVPAHSFKFIAALQEANGGLNPTLIRIGKKAGHGAGKPITKVLEDVAIKWGFMLWNMQIDFK
jgi:prolyl oligopeptidase